MWDESKIIKGVAAGGYMLENSDMFKESRKDPFRVIVPEGGSAYVDEGKTRRAIRSVLSVYGYLAGSSLGPRGAFKLVHGRYGDVIPTGKLYFVLEEVSKENPIVEMLWEAARGQWKVYGDGVKTLILLAYQLYAEGVELIEEFGLRPSVVIEGFQRAHRIHLEVMERLAGSTGPIQYEIATRSVAVGSQDPNLMASLLYRALQRYRARGCRIPLAEAVAVERIEGGSLYSSKVVDGVVARKRIMQYNAPKRLEGPLRVAIADQKLYIDLKGEGVSFAAKDPMLALRLRRDVIDLIKPLFSRLIELNVNVLVNVKGLDPVIEQWLQDLGIVVIRRLDRDRARLLALASGAKIVSRIQDLEEEDVGIIDSLEEINIGNRYYLVFRSGSGCASTIVLRGPWFATDLMYKEVNTALRALEHHLEDPRGLPGGGAPEVEASIRIRDEAKRAGGKEGIAMEAYADAIEVVPRTLARHSGLDPIEAINDLRSLHWNKSWAAGVDEDKLGIEENVLDRGIVDLYRIRIAAINAGFSLAASLLRITGISVHKRGIKLRNIREL